jgi:hypothetical protein
MAEMLKSTADLMNVKRAGVPAATLAGGAVRRRRCGHGGARNVPYSALCEQRLLGRSPAVQGRGGPASTHKWRRYGR